LGRSVLQNCIERNEYMDLKQLDAELSLELRMNKKNTLGSE
jgi:hypothetical protein